MGIDSSRPNSSAGKPGRPTSQISAMSATAIASRPNVYSNSHGATRGRAAAVPSGPAGLDAAAAAGAGALAGAAPSAAGVPGIELSAIAALPLRAEHDRRAGAGDTPDPVQRADGGFQCRDVAHAHLEHVALAAGHPPAVLDLLHLPQRALQAGVVDRVALDDPDERGDVQPDRGGVDDGAVAGDDPGRLQLADPFVHRRRGQPHLPRELGVRGPAVGAQQIEQLPVHGVDGSHRPHGLTAAVLAAVTEYSCGRTVGADEGVGRLAAFLVVFLVAVGVVVLLMRAATAANG